MRHRGEQSISQRVGLSQLRCGRSFDLEAGSRLGLAELADKRVEQARVVRAERPPRQYEDGTLVEFG